MANTRGTAASTDSTAAPMNSSTITWKAVGKDVFSAFPANASNRRSYAADLENAVIPALKEGKTVVVTVPSEDKIRGTRAILSRLAHAHGLVIEARWRGNEVAVQPLGTTEPVQHHRTGRPKRVKSTGNGSHNDDTMPELEPLTDDELAETGVLSAR